MMVKWKMLALIFAVLIALTTITLIHAQTPPALPATIYGNVTIQCSTGNTVYAPAGLEVTAKAPNGTVLASTQTGQGTSQPYQYILKIENYSGQANIYVGNIYITSLEVYSGLVQELNIEVLDNTPPEAPGGLYATVDSGYLTLSWEPAYDNLGVSYYVVKIYLGDTLLYNDTVEGINWTSPQPLGEGVYNATVTPVDLACNIGPTVSITVAIDTSPPAIVAASPVNGSIVTSTNFTPEFTVSETSNISQVDLILDGQEPIANYTLERMNATHWTLLVGLSGISEGAHTLTIVLTDEYGNSASYMYAFTIDVTPPVITFTTRINGTWKNEATFDVQAIVTDQVTGVDSTTISVTLNGTPVNYDYIEANNTLVVHVSVEPGWYTLTVKASDYAGITGEATVYFGVDLQPPTVHFLEPANGTVYTVNQVNITVQVTDDLSGIAPDLVMLLINDTEYYFNYDPQTGLLNATVFLNNGVWNITVYSEDLAGNPTTQYILVEVQSEAPSIIVASPGLLARGPEIRIKLTVTSPAGLDLVTVSVDGTPIEQCFCSGQNEYTIDTTIVLQSGLHTLYVEAVDVNGLVSVLNFTFIVDNDPPQITEASIANKSVVTFNLVTLEITISDQVSGIDRDSIRVYLNGAQVTYNYNVANGRLTATLTLEPGLNTIEVKVKDKAGWEAAAEYYILYDNDEPTIHAENFYYIDPAVQMPTITVRVNDVSLEGVTAGILPTVEIQPQIGSVDFTTNGVTIKLDIPKYTPYKVTLTFKDPAGREVADTFYLVIAEPTNHTLNLKPGKQVIVIPGGVFPDILEINLTQCTVNLRQVNADWKLQDSVTDYNYTVLIIASEAECKMSVPGFMIPVEGSMVVKAAGAKMIVVPKTDIGLEQLASSLGGEVLVVYYYNETERAWNTAIVEEGAVIGAIQILKAGQPYFIYKSDGKAGLTIPPTLISSESIEESSHSQATTRLFLLATTIAAGRETLRRPHATRLAPLAFAAVLLATPATAQVATLVDYPSNIETGTGYSPLAYTVEVGDSYNTSVYLVLKSSQPFDIVSAEIKVDGIPQEVVVEETREGYAVYSDTLRPASGTVIVNVVIYSNKSLELNWTLIVTMAQQVPVEPLVESGVVTISNTQAAQTTTTEQEKTTTTKITKTPTDSQQIRTTTTPGETTTTTRESPTTTTTTLTDAGTTTVEGDGGPNITIIILIVIGVATAILVAYLKFFKGSNTT